MGFFKKLSEKLSNSMLAPGAEETDGYYDEYDDDYDDYEYDEVPETHTRHTQQSRKNMKGSSSGSRSASRSSTISKDNVYGFTAKPSSVTVNRQAESLIMHPKNMDDAVEIGNHVRNSRMCIVDLTGVKSIEAQRIADYLCGISDALDGAINRVNNSIITVSPPNHRVTPNFREENPFEADFFSRASNDR